MPLRRQLMQLKLTATKINLFLLIILAALVFLSGCARTVTDKTIGGTTVSVKELEFTFTFRETPGGSNTTYYLIIATQNILQVINPAHTEPYFFAPGQEGEITESRVRTAYNLNSHEDLQKIYDDYFSTWDSYIKYTSTDQFNYYNNPGDPKNTPRPYVTSANYATYPYNTLSYGNLAAAGSKEIKFRIAVPYNGFYIDFLAVGNDHQLQDSLGAKQIIFSTNLNLSEPASNYTPTDGGLDLINFAVKGYEY